jgi:hypothetical protein
MPEEVVVAALASLGTEALAGTTVGAAMAMYGAEIYAGLQVAAFATAVYVSREQQRHQQRAALASYNASLKDRYLMVRSATEPRHLVLGRQRVSGPLAYIGSYGADRQHLVFVVLLAGHPIDAVESIYFDDEQVVLSGTDVVAVNRRDLFTLAAASDSFTLSSEPAAGTVVAVVDYGSTRVTLGTSVVGSVVTVTGGTVGQTGTVTISYQPLHSPFVVVTTENQTELITLDGSGNGSLVLAAVPDAGSVTVVYEVAVPPDFFHADLTGYSSTVGSTVTVTGSPQVSTTAVVSYRTTTTSSRARVRSYLGAAGQAADSAMVAALPGVWTSSHTLTGMAALVVELDYDVDAFPGGLPNVSALVRGALVHDPRSPSATDAWSENPALLMRHAATHALLGRLSTAQVNDAAVIVAANICDEVVSYVVQGQTYARALYTAGLTVKSGTRAKDTLDDLAKAMAGRWAFTGGQLRIKAGAYTTPLQALDETWLTDRSAVQVQVRANRGDVFNVVTGRIADASRDYAEVDYPRVESASYIAEDGAELSIDMPLNAVTFGGQAQQVAACALRDARQGLRVVLSCNMRAWPVEVFDTLTVTLPRFGWDAKVFEVLSVSWQMDGGIQLTLKETDATIWALGTSFEASDPAPNTLFPSPFKLPAITSLACASGTTQLIKQADGTVQTRVLVTWGAITDPLVNNEGGVEIRYGLATEAEAAWQSTVAPRGQAQAYLTENIHDRLIYLVKARAFNALVKGPWCLPVLHQVVGKTAAPANVAGLAATNLNGDVAISWTASSEPDYAYTEARYGASYAAGTFVGRIAGNTLLWPYASTPGAGALTIWAKHVDTSGNASATAASAAVTVTVPTLAGLDSTSSTKLGGIATGATKNIVSYSASAPGSPVDGDLWCDTSATPAVWKIRVSGAWQAAANYTTGALANLNTVGTAQIDAGAATQIVSDEQAAPTSSRTRPGIGIFEVQYRILAECSYTNSSGAAQTVEATVDAGGKIASGTGTAHIGANMSTADVDGNTVDGDQLTGLMALDSTTFLRRMNAATISLADGATVYAQAVIAINPTGSGMTVEVTGRDCRCRLTVIKR